MTLMARNEDFALLNENNGLNECIEKNFGSSHLVWIARSSKMDDILERCTDDLIRMLGSTGETHIKEVPIKRDGQSWIFFELFQCEVSASKARCLRNSKWISKTCMSNWSKSLNWICLSPWSGTFVKFEIEFQSTRELARVPIENRRNTADSEMRWRYFRISPKLKIRIWWSLYYLALYPCTSNTDVLRIWSKRDADTEMEKAIVFKILINL
jgi:hypothetical protein